MKTFKDAFIHELKDMLDAERQIVKALPKMAKKAEDGELRKAFETHLEQTRGQINRLEKCFDELGEKAAGHKCKGMKGIIEEGEDVLKESGDADGHLIDAMAIPSAQRVEHYEIAAYGTLCTWAEMLGEDNVLNLLKENLSEEKETDEKLTKIAMRINKEAIKETV